jgi:hypothetical protein
MLRDAVLALAREREVTVVARPGRVERLAQETPRVHAAPSDWHDAAGLGRALDAAVAARGPFELAIAWIHSDAPAAVLVAARRVRGRFVQVLPCEAEHPSRPRASRRPEIEALGLPFHEVVLGWIEVGRGSRWLTDAEISAGALAGIDDPRPRSVVGVVTPWSRRP